MAIIKCKMCGGDLEVTSNLSVAECEFCGTKQTLPKANEDVIQNLFNRANALRLKCEFDKAEQIYEKILQQNDAESEAHWGIILCKYGIEYVEDPKTFKRIPTCHRTSYDAVTTDADYLAAIEYADVTQRSIYEAEARTIDKIQKNILSIVKDEKPFDVFVCYKETDENGKRTVDSAIANDIYHQLTQEGLKVFYAAITLEDKLGQEYEPYIFAALNSAKVMLVIGTKPQYFTAVWVKNEWSRFLKLMKSDRAKLLIPCYKDMDAYELPEEFAHLQAQDMGKIGFINDVVRGIRKITGADASKAAISKEPAPSSGPSNAAPLLERAFMFLEDGDWSSADEYCEKVLDLDPKNAQAYWGKLMAELRVRKQEELKEQAEPFDGSNNYQKVIRFADDEQKNILEGYIAHIKSRNENAKKEKIYHQAKQLLFSARNVTECREAIRLFETIATYMDSAAQIVQCKKRIEELTEAAEQDRLEQARRAEIANQKATIRNKKINKVVLIAAPIICAAIVFAIVLTSIIIPNGKYKDAVLLLEAGKYAEAVTAFEEVGIYKDAEQKILEAKYKQAGSFFAEKQYNEAIALMTQLGDYHDAKERVSEWTDLIKEEAELAQEKAELAQKEKIYQEAIELKESDPKRAYELFASITDYEDAKLHADSFSVLITKELYNNEPSVNYSYAYLEDGALVSIRRTYPGSTYRLRDEIIYFDEQLHITKIECVPGVREGADYTNVQSITYSNFNYKYEEGVLKEFSFDYVQNGFGKNVDPSLTGPMVETGKTTFYYTNGEFTKRVNTNTWNLNNKKTIDFSSTTMAQDTQREYSSCGKWIESLIDTNSDTHKFSNEFFTDRGPDSLDIPACEFIYGIY